MASITTRSNGSRFITVRCAAGPVRHITLGQVAKRYADTVKVKVEDLAAARIHGHAPSDETTRWVAGLDDRMHGKLAAAGLVPVRRRETLGEAASRYISARVGDLKPESLRKLRQTEAKLRALLDPARPLRDLAPEDAVAWRRGLRALGLSEAAVRTHCGNAKSILGDAVRRGEIGRNPFAGLGSGPTPSRYTRYVTPGEIERVIGACPGVEWRLLFGLARYAGLRVPSESHLLTWAEVDFARGRLTVRSPKTERFRGHEQRLVPITPRLMELVQARFDACPDGEDRLVTINGKGALIRPVRRIWARAGVEPWERLWQTLRSSCEKEWAMSFPQYAVSKWIGHSITVSGRHYANAVPDELFDRAAGTVRRGDPEACAQRQAQLQAPETGGNA